MVVMTSAPIFPFREFPEFWGLLPLIKKTDSCSSPVLTTRRARAKISSQNIPREVLITLFGEGNREKSLTLFSAAGGHSFSGRAVPNPERHPRAKER
jgi:hypothetical protein